MIFLTGGTGLVGSHVLLDLCLKGKDVLALKREKSSLEICEKLFFNHNKMDLFHSIRWCIGDLENTPLLDDYISECNVVVHVAGLVSFQNSDKQKLIDVNVNGTANLVNVSLSNSIDKFLYVSSIATLGRNSTKEIVDEESYFKNSKIESNYAISKYLAEQEVWRASNEGLSVVIVNPSVILGPGDWNSGSSKIFQTVYNGLKFYTTGSTGFVDVEDVANIIVMLAEHEVSNQRFIINGCNETYQHLFNLIADSFDIKRPSIRVTPLLKEIAWRVEKIRSFLTQSKSIITKETAESVMRNSKFSSQKIKKLLDYNFIAFENTIKKNCRRYLIDIK